MSRNIAITFAGVGVSPYHDMQMRVYGWELHSDPETRIAYQQDPLSGFKQSEYGAYVVPQSYITSPILHWYYADTASAESVGVIAPSAGIQPLNETQTPDSASVYRRQYQQYYQPSTNRLYTYAANQWEPVSVYGQGARIHDFNIKSNTFYQYMIYPTSTVFAEAYATVSGKDYKIDEARLGASWPCWSLIELVEQDNPFSGKRQATVGEVYTPSPTVKGMYLANTENAWFFKYDVDTGSVAQNITRSAVQTLGQFPKYSQGLSNYESGSVSCYLGSEVLPFDPVSDYIERMQKGVETPLSTNEGAYMLQKWRSFVYSKNPKLLRDMKGQAWIVQIETASNTPSNYIFGQPIKISFTWKQVADTNGAIIYANNTEATKIAQAQPGDIGSRWSVYDPLSASFKYVGISPNKVN